MTIMLCKLPPSIVIHLGMLWEGLVAPDARPVLPFLPLPKLFSSTSLFSSFPVSRIMGIKQFLREVFAGAMQNRGKTEERAQENPREQERDARCRCPSSTNSCLPGSVAPLGPAHNTGPICVHSKYPAVTGSHHYRESDGH